MSLSFGTTTQGEILITCSSRSGDSQQQQQRREVVELLTRDIQTVHPIGPQTNILDFLKAHAAHTRDVSDEQSGAISLGAIGDIFSFAEPIVSGIFDKLTGKQKRELVTRILIDHPLRLTPIFGVPQPIVASQTRSLNDLD